MDNVWATQDNTKVGDVVSVPVHGEHGHGEQICIDYEVVKALRCKVPKSKQIIGIGQKPLPKYLPLTGEQGYINI